MFALDSYYICIMYMYAFSITVDQRLVIQGYKPHKESQQKLAAGVQIDLQRLPKVQLGPGPKRVHRFDQPSRLPNLAGRPAPVGDPRPGRVCLLDGVSAVGISAVSYLLVFVSSFSCFWL